MRAHETRHIHREEILRWEWWLYIVLVVVWGMECSSRLWVENGTVPRWVVFPGFF